MAAELTYAELLASKGVTLLQPQDIALRRADALTAVEIVRQLPLPIIGGSVYFLRNGCVEFAYAAWSCDPRDGENGKDYITRSCDESRRYIAMFPHRDDVEPVFLLGIYRR